MDLTHLDEQNKPKMVDVSDKDSTTRIATASGIIEVGQAAFEAVLANTAKKGTRAANCGYRGHTRGKTNLYTHSDVPPFDAHVC